LRTPDRPSAANDMRRRRTSGHVANVTFSAPPLPYKADTPCWRDLTRHGGPPGAFPRAAGGPIPALTMTRY